MKILLTGGTGYIGSHTAVELIQQGYEVALLDNFANSSPRVIERIQTITGIQPQLLHCDLQEIDKCRTLLKNVSIDAVIHFAGLKAVGESTTQPEKYYRTNITSTLNLLTLMKEQNIDKLVFSSSATVYGNNTDGIAYEFHQAGVDITNPYGWTKFMNEQIIKDFTTATKGFKSIALRYFNPIGAHHSGLIGENPNGIPNNLMPYLLQVAVGKLKQLTIFGDNYNTKDGTGVRDYIHVTDLANAHIQAINYLSEGFDFFNIGNGVGTSVLEMIDIFQTATGIEIPYRISDRRAGDIATLIADVEKASKLLGFTTQKSIEDACRDSWLWQSTNPDGYK